MQTLANAKFSPTIFLSLFVLRSFLFHRRNCVCFDMSQTREASWVKPCQSGYWKSECCWLIAPPVSPSTLWEVLVSWTLHKWLIRSCFVRQLALEGTWSHSFVSISAFVRWRFGSLRSRKENKSKRTSIRVFSIEWVPALKSIEWERGTNLAHGRAAYASLALSLWDLSSDECSLLLSLVPSRPPRSKASFQQSHSPWVGLGSRNNPDRSHKVDRSSWRRARTWGQTCRRKD